MSDAPGLEILIDDQIVGYASLISGSQTLDFNLSYSGSALPSSFSLRFQNDGSSESSRSVTIEAVRINAQPVNTSYLTQLTLLANEASNIDTVATASLFTTLTEDGIDPDAPPTDAELGTPTHGAAYNEINETIKGTANDDVALGHGGNDIVRTYDGNDAASLGDGNDTGYAGAGNDIMTGGAGDDRLYGEDGDDILFGEDGVDRIYGGSGDDFISGGNGNDWAFADIGNDTLHGGAGDDLFYGGDGNDTLHGDDGNDKLYGDAGDDTLTGGEGDDRLYGSDGNDHISGDAGADRLYGSQGNDTVLGGEGDDFVYGGTEDDILFGGTGHDRIYGQEDNDILNGGEGDDRIYGGSGDDIMNGGTGIDNLYGDTGNDTAYGGEGNDRIYGDGGDDTLFGEAGSDRIYADIGNDILDGGDGDDFLYTGSGNNTAYGGAGNDRVYAAEGNDTIFGGIGVDRLYGDAGEDYIEGGDGDDYIYAGDDNDTAYGGAGTDRIIAGAGDDFAYGGLGKDILYGNEGNDTIFGEEGDDWISGNEGNDIIHGGLGKDIIYGYHDDDLVNGDDGDDFINGGLGNDTINGGNDNDFLVGNDGSDIINGDAGDDIIYALNFVEDIQAKTLSELIIDNDPVAYWQFNETTGSTALNQGEATGIDAATKEGATLGSTAINETTGASIEFDGIDDYVSITDSDLINATTVAERTIELVFNADTTTGRQVLYEEGGSVNALTIYIDDGKIYFNGVDRSGAVWGPFDISTEILAGETYHAALTLDANAGTFKGFLNGVEVGSGAIDGVLSQHVGDIGIGSMNNGNYFHDGADNAGRDHYFDGKISDVAVYNSVLTETDFLARVDAMELSASPTFDDGVDILHGGDGNDTLYASGGEDELYGDAGNDNLHGSVDSNILEGGTGDDIIYADGYQIDAATVIVTKTLSEEILENAPITYWSLGETSGTTLDNQGSLGSATDGTLTNGAIIGAAALYDGGGSSVDFDGVNDIITIPNSDSINTSSHDERTVELVFNADTTAGRQVLYEEGGATNALNIYIDEGQLYVLGRDADDWDVFDISTSINAGQTYHVALVLDQPNGTLSGYLDGDLIGSSAITSALSSHSNAIGIGAVNGDTYFHDGAYDGSGAGSLGFDGRISDVALYNDALSQEDIQDRADIVAGITGTNSPIYDTLTGGDGFDQLYGGNDRDLFVFEAASIFNDTDQINDFSVADGDTLDISDILEGFSENKLDRFLELTEVNGDTILSIDVNGQKGGADFVNALQFNDTTGLDLQVLYDNGQIIL